MKGSLNEIPILDVAARLGIDVVSSFGSSRKCRCFMHDDRHPNMNIWPGTNTWYCFVCQQGGSVIDLVMKYKDIDFVEACRWLAPDRVGFSRHTSRSGRTAGWNAMGLCRPEGEQDQYHR